MTTEYHADEAIAALDDARRALDRADNTEPSKLSRDLYLEAQAKATIALTHAVLSLRVRS